MQVTILRLILISVALSRVFCFSANRACAGSIKASMTSMSMQQPKVTLYPLPKLYVYDHCPFCVRVRLAFGLKSIKHELIFLGNDDAATPTALVGKKIAPILTVDGQSMPESLDIIAKVDTDPKFGTVGFFKPMSGRADLKAWQEKVKDRNQLLQRPRYMRVPLPEFHQEDGRNFFISKHLVPPYDKDSWAQLSLDQKWQKFDSAYIESKSMIDAASASLVELDNLIYSPHHCSPGGLSLDDIDLWSRLRSLTLVKGLIWPIKLRKYMDYLSKSGDVPLLDAMAC